MTKTWQESESRNADDHGVIAGKIVERSVVPNDVLGSVVLASLMSASPACPSAERASVGRRCCQLAVPEPTGPGEALDAPTSGAPAPVSRSSTVVPSGAARTDDGRCGRFSVLSCRQTNSAAPDHQEPHAEFCRLGARTAFPAAPRNVNPQAWIASATLPTPAFRPLSTRTNPAGCRRDKRSRLNSRLQ